MIHTYFALLAPDGMDALKRRAGYARAIELVDALRDDAARALPEARRLRANRASVEFVLEAASPAKAERLLRRLRDDLAGEIGLDGQAVPRTVTVAAAPCPRGVVSDAIVLQAETLLRDAQRTGVGVSVAAAGMAEQDDHALLDQLRRAIDEDGLELHYQPKLRARTGELAGAEALLRWTHPAYGAVPPGLFVPMAERSGDIRALTRWAIARAIADQGVLARAGWPTPCHVNISAPLLAEPDFTAAILAQVGSHSPLIGFEITETAMIADPEATLARLHGIAEAGIRLAIDDYGTGFSSLAYLQRLPVHELKIDRMFIDRLATNARDPLLVRSTINLAHALEMEVTAEGVETAPALALLQVMGCDLVQGFFLSAALPLDGLIAFARAAAAGTALPRPATLRERLAERRAVAAGAS